MDTYKSKDLSATTFLRAVIDCDVIAGISVAYPRGEREGPHPPLF